jgi:uncharacterized protein YbcI
MATGERDIYRPRGEVLAGISSGIVGLYREHFGKGPTKAKTYVLDDVVICVLRDGLTTVERTLFAEGRADSVREMRAAFQEAVADKFKSVVENLTGRKVVAFLSQAHVNPDLAIELFFLDRPVSPFGVNEELVLTERDQPGVPESERGRSDR